MRLQLFFSISTNISLTFSVAITCKMLRFTILFLCLLFTVKAEPLKYHKHGEEAFKKPDFCHGLDCPSYTVVEKTADYELREYSASQWVTTNSTGQGLSFKTAEHTNFGRLFSYIQGNNTRKEKIAMTAPVLATIVPNESKTAVKKFNMYFFVSPSEGDPPQPSDEHVFLTEKKTFRVYVRSFSGYVYTEDKWTKEAIQLAMALQQKTFHKDFFFAVGYDSPFRLVDRHNEVWFFATK